MKTEDYFDKINNSEMPPFPFDEKELRDILDKKSATNDFMDKIKGNKTMISIGTAIGGALLVGALIFSPHDDNAPLTNKTQPEIVQSAKPVDNIEKKNNDLDKPLSEISKEGFAIASNVVENFNETQASSNEKPNEEKTSEEKNVGIKLPKLIVAESGKPISSIPVLILSDKELEGLGIYKTKTGYKFTAESILTEEDFAIKDISKVGYERKLGLKRKIVTLDTFSIKDEIEKYGGWDMEMTRGDFPLCISSLRKQGDYGFGSGKSSFGYTAIFDVKKSHELINNTLSNIEKKIFLAMKNNSLNSSVNLVFDSNENVPNEMVPVVLQIGDKTNYSITVIWYPATEAFLKKIPADIRSSVASAYIKPVQPLSVKACNDGKWWNYSDEIMQVSDGTEEKMPQMGGIRMMKLTDSELEKFGIFRVEDHFESFVEHRVDYSKIKDQATREKIKEKLSPLGYDTTINTIVRTKIFIMKRGIESPDEGMPYTGWDIVNGDPSRPVVAQTLWRGGAYNDAKKDYEMVEGTQTYMFESPLVNSRNTDIFDMEKGIPKINKLLPIELLLVKGGDTPAEAYATVVYLWLHISRESVMLLPDRYKVPLMSELDLISSLEAGEIKISDICKGLPNESYFDVCKLNSGIITFLGTYPNPSNEEINLSFKLEETRIVHITIYNSDGKSTGTYDFANEFGKGTHTHKIQAKELGGDGIYLVSIETDKGERVTGKIIVGGGGKR